MRACLLGAPRGEHPRIFGKVFLHIHPGSVPLDEIPLKGRVVTVDESLDRFGERSRRLWVLELPRMPMGL